MSKYNSNTNSEYGLSEGELDNICSALRAMKIKGTDHVPLQLQLETLILPDSLGVSMGKLKPVMSQFFRDHQRSLTDFAKNQNQWSFTYHYMSGFVGASSVKNADGIRKTEITCLFQYNIKDMYSVSPLDHVIFEEMICLYSDIKAALEQVVYE